MYLKLHKRNSEFSSKLEATTTQNTDYDVFFFPHFSTIITNYCHFSETFSNCKYYKHLENGVRIKYIERPSIR